MLNSPIKLSSLLKSIHIPLVILDQKNKILYFSSPGKKIIGLKDTDAGKSILSLELNIPLQGLKKYLQECHKGKKIKSLDIQNNKGTWYSLYLDPAKDTTGKYVCIITLIEINKLKRALYDVEIAKKDALTLNRLYQYRVTQRTRMLEEEVRERKKIEADIKQKETLYRILLEHYPNGSIILHDKDYRVILTEGMLYKRMKIDKKSFINKTIYEYMEPGSIPHFEKFLSGVFKGRNRYTEMKFGEEYYSVTAVPVRDERNRIFGSLSFVNSITKIRKTEEQRKLATTTLKLEIKERKQAEASLRILSRHLIRAQENERVRLSRELHDSVNQLLSAAKLKLHNVEENILELPGTKNTLKNIGQSKEYLERAIAEVRNLSKNLRPIPLEDTGIHSALENLCNEFSDRAGVKVKCDFKEFKKRISADLELAIYRIVQEAIHNVEKHAAAKLLTACLKIEGSKIRLEIADDGEGFDIDELKKKRHYGMNRMGLISMRERVEFLRGKFDIQSIPGSGTKIVIAIPAIYRSIK